MLPIETAIQSNNEITGKIISIDRFGNLISNIGDANLKDICSNKKSSTVEVKIGGKKITGLSTSYANSLKSEPLAIIGSRGLLEIALNKGDAQKYFKVEKDDVRARNKGF